MANGNRGGHSLRERFGHVLLCPTPRGHSSRMISGKLLRKMGIHVSGEKVQHQILSIIAHWYLAYLCDNFEPFVVLGLSNEANLTRSAEYSAENTMEVTPDDQGTTRPSRNRLRDLPEWVQDSMETLVGPRSTSSGSDCKDPPEPFHQSTKSEAQTTHAFSQRSK